MSRKLPGPSDPLKKFPRPKDLVPRPTKIIVETLFMLRFKGFLGTKEGAIDYANELVEDWLFQLQQLTQIAKSEPQSAYAAFTAGFKHKLT